MNPARGCGDDRSAQQMKSLRLRCQWVVLAVLMSAALTAGCQHARPTEGTARRAEGRGRPNILFAIADDWSWPHASVYGDNAVSTPVFDRVAREGVRFSNAFTAAPSCTPARAAILTGQYPHRLAEGAMLHGFLPRGFPYTRICSKRPGTMSASHGRVGAPAALRRVAGGGILPGQSSKHVLPE